VVYPGWPGYSQAIECGLSQGHRGRHRGEEASWEDEGRDFAPSDYTVRDVGAEETDGR